LAEPAAVAVVIGMDVALRSFRERLPARLVGWQPILTFVSVGELAQRTKLRHGGPRNLAMPGSWLAGKPVVPASKAIAAIWGGLSAAAIQRVAPAGQHHLGCCLLPRLPAAARHPQPQGFQGRRRAPRGAAARAVAGNRLAHGSGRPNHMWCGW